MKRTGIIASLSALGLALAACSGGDSTSSDGKLPVTASFYPLAFVAEEVGGDLVTVTDLTPPGSSAHGVELSPKAIADMEKSKVVFYLKTMSPAIDDAVATTKVNALEVGATANLLPRTEIDAAATDDHDHEGETAEEHAAHADETTAAADDHDHEGETAEEHAAHADETTAATDGHEGESEDEHAGHDHGVNDPHYWTDPSRVLATVDPMTEALVKADPDNKATYEKNAADLKDRLGKLVESYKGAFAQCETTSFVVTHKAFGYLAKEYELTQIGIAGFDPEVEPSPARVMEIKKLVESNNLTTIFATSEEEATTARAVAEETKTEIEVLDAASTKVGDKDYIALMENNLTLLKDSMRCK